MRLGLGTIVIEAEPAIVLSLVKPETVIRWGLGHPADERSDLRGEGRAALTSSSAVPRQNPVPVPGD